MKIDRITFDPISRDYLSDDPIVQLAERRFSLRCKIRELARGKQALKRNGLINTPIWDKFELRLSQCRSKYSECVKELKNLL